MTGQDNRTCVLMPCTWSIACESNQSTVTRDIVCMCTSVLISPAWQIKLPFESLFSFAGGKGSSKKRVKEKERNYTCVWSDLSSAPIFLLLPTCQATRHPPSHRRNFPLSLASLFLLHFYSLSHFPNSHHPLLLIYRTYFIFVFFLFFLFFFSSSSSSSPSLVTPPVYCTFALPT